MGSAEDEGGEQLRRAHRRIRCREEHILLWISLRHLLVQKRGLMPGHTFSNELISRDESFHARFACLIYGLLQCKLPDDVVHEMIQGAVALEQLHCGIRHDHGRRRARDGRRRVGGVRLRG